jgi:hypothetical protein
VGLWQKTKSGISRLSVKQVAANKKKNNQEKEEDEVVWVVVDNLWKRVTWRKAETKQGIWTRLRNRIKKI